MVWYGRASFQKIPCLVGRLGSGVRVSASCQIFSKEGNRLGYLEHANPYAVHKPNLTSLKVISVVPLAVRIYQRKNRTPRRHRQNFLDSRRSGRRKSRCDVEGEVKMRTTSRSTGWSVSGNEVSAAKSTDRRTNASFVASEARSVDCSLHVIIVVVGVLFTVANVRYDYLPHRTTVG